MRVVVLSLLPCVVAAHAQAAPRPVTVSTPEATRAELTARLDSLERVDSVGGNTAQRRDRRAEIGAIRSRLAEGDYQVGDRFLLDFGGERRTDTVTVRDGGTVTLLNWPAYSLHGVLRSELQGALERYIGTFVREPKVRVYPLTRLGFVGAFARPGYIAVDPTRPLSDAISAAGPGSSARYDKIVIYRGTSQLLDSKTVSRALRNGQTVDELGLQSGDEIRIAERTRRNWVPVLQATVFSITALTAILALIRSSYTG